MDNDISVKKCPRCGQEKSLEDFWNDRSRSAGKFPWCKKCNRDYRIRTEIWKRAWVPPQYSKNGSKKIRERRAKGARKASYPFFLRTRFEFNIPRKWTETYRFSTVFGLNQKAEDLKVRLAHELQDLMKDKKIYHNKLFVVMTIYKPRVSHRNEYYLQLISQVVQHVTKLSSTWYCYQIDWAIDKEKPGVLLSLIQTEAAHKQVCYVCGDILLLKDFVRNRNLKLGHHYICKWCDAIRMPELQKAYRERTALALPYSRSRRRKKGITSPI